MSLIKAKNHVVGEKFKHCNGCIYTVVVINGIKFFANEDEYIKHLDFNEGEILYML